MNAFGKPHYLLLALAALVALAGMFLLSTGLETDAALVAAPILLFLAYVVMIPAALLWPAEKKQVGAGQTEKP